MKSGYRNRGRNLDVSFLSSKFRPLFHCFLRLKNLTLGYTLPKKWTNKFHASRLRVYVTGQNLFCLNNYSGYDPEVNSLNNPMMPGLDWGAYPKSRVFTVGIDLQF